MSLKTITHHRQDPYVRVNETLRRPDWSEPATREQARRTTANIRALPPLPTHAANERSALFMSETIEHLNVGAHFLDRLSAAERDQVREAGRPVPVPQGEMVFRQGDRHDGIFIIERGSVRVYYTAPSGREITLAYWTPGHFIGGPEISGGGIHMWSGIAIDDCRITMLPGEALQRLLERVPNFALALIDGLVAKGKCYSSMAQMLGTRSVIERLAQYLLNLSELYGTADGDTIVINHKVTHDQIAAMVGSTRQWVTMMLKRFQAKRIIAIEGSVIRIRRLDQLEQVLSKS
ncbi:cyclic nucleotide-binding protein [Afipia sp. P52-10]|nr:cyclic nucleotide-binding protein [Afipia sp. P52-10]